MQEFGEKSDDLAGVFNSCWVLEIQNEVSANQRGSSTNHIGRFGGLDVISGIIGDRYLNHLYTIEKWHVQQESIQIAESITLLLRGVKESSGTGSSTLKSEPMYLSP